MTDQRILLLENILIPHAKRNLENLHNSHFSRQYYINRLEEYELELKEYKAKMEKLRGTYEYWRNK